MQIWSFWHNAQFIELGDLSESCVQVSLEPITENCWFRRAAACCELTEKKLCLFQTSLASHRQEGFGPDIITDDLKKVTPFLMPRKKMRCTG